MRTHGEKKTSDISQFAHELKIEPGHIVGMSQVHGNAVELVTQKQRGTIIFKCDGLETLEKETFLYATFADCVPLLFFDKETRLIGLCHAGWRGIYKEIVPRMLISIFDQGAKVENVLVGIGPSIRSCCYEVSEGLANDFAEKFRKEEKYIVKRGNKIFLSLQDLICLQLLGQGVLKKHIINSMLCTNDLQSEFYSYRNRTDKNKNEVFAAIIGRYA